jgi:DNA-directed RNA polymerase specialized sigma24 family protein
MPTEIPCHCILCDTEAHLLSELTLVYSPSVNALLSACPAWPEHSTIKDLLSHLRTSRANAAQDNLFREIFSLRKTNPAFAKNLLVIIFLPMLHRAARLIARQQASLSEEDIAQQLLFFFLEFLNSPEIQTRQSHFAFAIAREVKRDIFEWANREGRKAALVDHADAEADVFIEPEGSLEQYALLRHFLDRCLTHGLLADSEFDLLIHFKLDGNSGEECALLNGSSSNAVRQRFKRLLAKLRKLAR